MSYFLLRPLIQSLIAKFFQCKVLVMMLGPDQAIKEDSQTMASLLENMFFQEKHVFYEVAREVYRLTLAARRAL